MINKIKKAEIFIFFLLIWIFPLINNYQSQVLISIVCYITSVFSLLFIKRKSFALILSILSLIPVVIYDVQYLFFAIPPFFNLFEYVQIIKREKKERNSFYINAHTSVLIGIVAILYQCFRGSITSKITSIEPLTVILVGFFLFLSFSATCLSKNTHWNQIATKHILSLKKLRYIHITNILCFIESIIMFFLNTPKYSERVCFFPWFLYLSVMIYCNDPILVILLKKTEFVFNCFTEKTK